MLGDGFPRCVHIELTLVQFPMKEYGSFVSVRSGVWPLSPTFIKPVYDGIFSFQVGEARIDDVVIFSIRANTYIACWVYPFLPGDFLNNSVEFVWVARLKRFDQK